MLSQQSENVLFGQSRNVLLTESRLRGGRRTATDEPSRARPAGCPEEGEEETDYSKAGRRGDRRHGAAGAGAPLRGVAGRGRAGAAEISWGRGPTAAGRRGGTA